MDERPTKASDVSAPPADPTRSPLVKSDRRWLALALMLVIGGAVGSVIAARSVARSDSADARNSFEQTAREVASTLELAIQRQGDVAVNSSALLIANPGATQGRFRALVDSARLLERYPEVLGFGFVALVPAAELPAFVAEVALDPPGELDASGSYEIVPPGERPFYCLIKLGVTRANGILALGQDFCAGGELGPAQDSGQSTLVPFAFEGRELLAVYLPLYRGGEPPLTADTRDEAFIGWMGTVSEPGILLERALQAHPELEVSMRFGDDASTTFSSGAPPPGSQSATNILPNGWRVETFGVVAGGGMLSDEKALFLLIGGVVLSLLLAALVAVLGTGRARAWRMVGERTGELRHQALHDALTGLPNRALIMDRIDQLLIRNRRNRSTGAALFVDLDDFKNVNDTLGHEAGDQLLVAVAARLTSSLRDADTIGRMGGDEFVVLIDLAAGTYTPDLVAERLLDVLRQPFEFDGARLPLTVTATVGIATGDRETGGDLLRDADVALYQAKAAGKNRFEIFDPTMQTEVTRRVELEFDLREAIDAGQFRIVYQPIYNLDDLSLAGVEALLRWDHPTLGAIEPQEFIPILERTGQILSVGRWVLRQSCEQVAAWHARGDTLDVSVNVSGRQLDEDAIVEDIREALESSGLPATSLIVEVTETALMRDITATAQRLRAIKALGASIAIDDFGTGYSSLAYLQQFPVDCLKIDRSFTNAITSSPESKALIGTLIQLGRDLGLTTVAEGVETAGEVDQLRREHVNRVQGTLLSGPLDPQTLESEILRPLRPAVPGTRP